MSKTLLLVDDHPLFRRGLKELIVDQSTFYNKVIEAGNGEEALGKINRFSPHTVMLDIAMPGIDGLATLEIIRATHPQVRCIIMSMYDNPQFVVQAREKGAKGYILKTDSDTIILDCLYSVEHGAQYLSESLSVSSDTQVPAVQIDSSDIERLSPREKEILGLIAKCRTSKEIAQQLTVSLRTVQNHRVNICRKLSISGSNALLKIAIEHQAWL